MRRFYIWLWLLILVCGSCTKEKQELSVLHLNIWMEGTVVKNGFEAVADEVARIDPDIVMFSEASNKEDALFVPRMLDALRERGKIYYGQGSSLDVALLSKYPILEQTENIPHKDRVLRTRLDVNGKQVVAYTGHLDYTHYACYLPRGYSGVTWKKLEAPVTDKAEIEKANNESLRDESIRLVIEDATKSDADFVILGGDFNEPSHLDWTEETKGLWDHNGAVVDWACSKLLYEAGFRDAYRVKYPNPITHPGFTFPSDNPAMPVERLTWAPEADEFYLLYTGNRLGSGRRRHRRSQVLHYPQPTCRRGQPRYFLNSGRHLADGPQRSVDQVQLLRGGTETNSLP